MADFAIVPLGATKFRPLAGRWPVVRKDGRVYVHHMHEAAARNANGGRLGPVDASGWVRLDATGRVIDSVWSDT